MFTHFAYVQYQVSSDFLRIYAHDTNEPKSIKMYLTINVVKSCFHLFHHAIHQWFKGHRRNFILVSCVGRGVGNSTVDKDKTIVNRIAFEYFIFTIFFPANLKISI